MHRDGGQGGNTPTHCLVLVARVFTLEELQVHLRALSPRVTAVRGQAEQEGGHPTLRDRKGHPNLRDTKGYPSLRGRKGPELRGHRGLSRLSV